MNDPLPNVYADDRRAASYAELAFPGTYYLAFRDLPQLLEQHARGTRALDFGCGTGRSTRFLRELGYQTVGVDIAEAMIARARERDPAGEYHVIPDGDFARFAHGSFDLVLSAFTFDNMDRLEHKVALFDGLRHLLVPDTGRLVNLVSAPEIYINEWASFTTKDFPENRDAQTGDRVRIVMLDVPDRRPVEDVLCTDDGYREVYRRADLTLIDTHRPMGRESDPVTWVSEHEVSPWVIYLLAAQDV